MRHYLGPAFRMTLLLTILTGLVYPLVMTGLCQALFPRQANGSMIAGANGEVVGSALIGQNFTSADYFHSRPSAAGKGYDAENSGGSNLGPTSQALMNRVQADAAAFARDNPAFKDPLPADLLTSSGSGLDPDISPASARAQVARVAAARGVYTGLVLALVNSRIEPPQLGFLGEARVNVLQLNLALDRQFPRR